MKLEQFKEVWVLDFEFGEKDPGIPRPLCLVAKELNQNKKIRLWLDEQGGADSPFKISGDVLLVAYFATAELSCFLELGWEFPEKLLDLYVEFRNLTNGLNPPLGNGLLGAMSFFGLSHIDSADKETMRALALEGGPYTPKEKTDLLDYCQSDVLATEALLEKMAGLVDIDRALIRGEYIKALSQIERRGISLDKKLFNELKEYWEEIQDLLIEEIDQDFNVFEEKTFKRERFEEYLNYEGISWPDLIQASSI